MAGDVPCDVCLHWRAVPTETPLHANWGDRNVSFRKEIYCNFNLTLVIDASIAGGDYYMFDLNAVIASSSHLVLPVLRDHN